MEAAAGDIEVDKSKVCEKLGELEGYKDHIEEVHEDFLDDAFGDFGNRTTRHEFLKTIEKNC